MADRDPHPDSPPDNDNDARSDVERIVEAQKGAVERGEGGRELDSFTPTGEPDGVGDTGGAIENQDDTQ